MNNPVDLKTIEMWIRTQIARPNADPVYHVLGTNMRENVESGGI